MYINATGGKLKNKTMWKLISTFDKKNHKCKIVLYNNKDHLYTRTRSCTYTSIFFTDTNNDGGQAATPPHLKFYVKTYQLV